MMQPLFAGLINAMDVDMYIQAIENVEDAVQGILAVTCGSAARANSSSKALISF
jgi:hypothetical protein